MKNNEWETSPPVKNAFSETSCLALSLRVLVPEEEDKEKLLNQIKNDLNGLNRHAHTVPEDRQLSPSYLSRDHVGHELHITRRPKKSG